MKPCLTVLTECDTMYQNLITRTLTALLALGVATDSYLILRHPAVPATAKQAGPEPGLPKASLLAVNGHPVANAGQLRERVGKAGKHVALLVRRREEKIFVAVDLG